MQHILQDPLSQFIAQAVVILGVSRLVGLATRRVDQPMVIAEIAAGIVLGPSLLGWVLPGVGGALFPASSLPLLSLVSQVGLLLFMFLIGLELDPKLLQGRGRTSVAISHSSIVVPFGLGGLLSLYLYPRMAPEGVSFSAFALFLGAAMSVTAFPVLARILAERRMLQSEVGALTITCAAVDDVTAWCVLAFVVSIVRSSGVGGAIRTTALALGYIGAMVWLVRPFLARLGARSDNREGLSQNVVAVTLLLLLLSSFVTEQIGIHALFGAFLFGAIMPRQGGFVRVLAEKLEDVVLVFLLPLFFAYSGLRTQIGLLDSWHAWLMCALIVLVACVGKFGGSVAAARVMGVPWREAAAVGVLMNTRGLMELVVLNMGLDLGVISPTLFTMMVLMALMTTFMTSPLLRWIYPPEQVAQRQREAIATPMPAAAEPAFTVLMCVAFDRSGPGMVTLAAALSPSPSRGRLYALRLIPPSERASFVLRQDPDADEGGALSPLLERASALSTAVKPLSFVSAHPADDICNVADVKQADLVLLGWHKPLLSRATLGGTVHEVMRGARAQVGVFVDRGLRRVERVLVPFHGTAHDQAALRLARRLRDAGARVTVLEVTAKGQRPGEAQAAVEAAFDGADGVELRGVVHETPARAALDEAARGYDLVVVGVGHEWGLEHRPFGVHRELLVDRCPTSLLVVRHHDARAPQLAGPARASMRSLSPEVEPS